MRPNPRTGAAHSKACLIAAFAVASTGAAQAATLTTLYSFGSATGDGLNPQAGLTMDASGDLYGATKSGGSSNDGTVFKLTPGRSGTWTESVLYSFAGGSADGANPEASLTMDAAGNLFGTTINGGASGYGTVFELALGTGGTYTENVLHSFTGSPDGKNPFAELVKDSQGRLYGTTENGGTYGWGAVFRLTPGKNGKYSESVIWSFSGCPNGQTPGAGVIMDSTGALYGTTWSGGGDCVPNGYGSVYKLTPGQGSYTLNILYRFGGGSDGTSPFGLTMDFSGAIYGTVDGGGAYGGGDVFKLTPGTGGSYTFSVLYSFAGGTDGANPYASLFRSNDSVLYGTTAGGAKAGTIFRYEGPAERELYAFSGGSDGANPYAPLISPSPGVLYGTTYNGGAHGGGTVFEMRGH